MICDRPWSSMPMGDQIRRELGEMMEPRYEYLVELVADLLPRKVTEIGKEGEAIMRRVLEDKTTDRAGRAKPRRSGALARKSGSGRAAHWRLPGRVRVVRGFLYLSVSFITDHHRAPENNADGG